MRKRKGCFAHHRSKELVEREKWKKESAKWKEQSGKSKEDRYR
jgi:hypothetical protein